MLILLNSGLDFHQGIVIYMDTVIDRLDFPTDAPLQIMYSKEEIPLQKALIDLIHPDLYLRTAEG